MNEQLYNDIDTAVTTICRANDTPSKLSNGVASVFYDGIRIANDNGFDWIDGEGFSSAYYDAAIKGMKHTLYADDEAAVFDPDFDIGSGCEESCEVFSDEDNVGV